MAGMFTDSLASLKFGWKVLKSRLGAATAFISVGTTCCEGLCERGNGLPEHPVADART